MVKHDGFDITFQEVPDEISLVFPITQCPHRCPGCHSANLRSDIGEDLSKTLPSLLDKYGAYITCVCFMGEGNDPDGLAYCIEYAMTLGFKTAVYSGSEDWTGVDYIQTKLPRKIDYVKIGPYVEALGGLDSKTTNQKMYRWSKIKKKYIDVTYLFQKEKK